MLQRYSTVGLNAQIFSRCIPVRLLLSNPTNSRPASLRQILYSYEMAMGRRDHMDPFVKSDELREQFEANRVQFVLTELDTGMTFCDVAKSSADPEKIKRNVTNACKAYK